MTIDTNHPTETTLDVPVPEPAAEQSAASTDRWRSRRVRVVAAATVLAAIVGGLGLLRWSPWSEDVPADAALVVDGHVVTIAALDSRMDSLRALYGVVRPTDPAALTTFRRDAAKSIAVSMILDQSIANRGIKVSDKKVQDALDRFVAEQFGDGGHEQFVRSLGNVGTSEKQVLDEIRRQLEYTLLVDDVVGTVTVSDGELAAQFQQRKDEFATPELRTVRNIVVADESTAEQVRTRLAKGENIARVAAALSIDVSTRDSGGSLGAVSRGELEQAVGDVVFRTARGRLYGPVEGAHGWNVGRVDAIAPPRAADLATSHEEFRAQLVSEEGARRWWAWVSAQLKAADVKYADTYRPSDPDAAPGNQPGLPSGSLLGSAP